METQKSSAFTPGLAVSEGVTVTKLRELPLLGELLVKVGDSVKPQQEVAHALLPGDLHILRLSEKMGITPQEVVRGLKVSVGESVGEGQLLCEHAGLFGWLKTRFKAPFSGALEMISEPTGHIGVRTQSKALSIRAFIGGTVVAVEERKSVTISTTAAFVQGIFGVGGERLGKLAVLDVDPTHTLVETDIPSDCTGRVLVGGTCPTVEVLKLAAERGATGMVVGSIDDQALTRYVGRDIGIALTGDEEITMSLIVTEGFGSLAMSPRIPTLLRKFQGSNVSLNGATQVRAGAVRPELIVSELHSGGAASTSDRVAQEGGLSVGRSIRIIRVPYFGMKGTVVELPTSMEKIPTGAYARVLRAKLEDDSVVTIPRANAELIA